MDYRLIFNPFLIHYGIKNQKWHVRRFQNKDGSLTPAGRLRYGVKNKKESTLSDKKDNDKQNNKTENNSIFKKNIKIGKDKSPISSAEKIAKDTEKLISEASQLTSRFASKKQQKKSSSEIDSLSNKELKDRIERLRLEKEYSSLKDRDISTGKSRVSTILETIGSVATIASTATSIISTIKNI